MHDVRNSSTELEVPYYGADIRTLKNGLEVIIREDASAPVASLQLWVKAGSIHEGDWLGAGLSHFVEHMLFKGTDSRHYSQIAREIQETGGYVNAYTSFDRTVYWIDAPSKGVSSSLNILGDMAMNSTFPVEEFEKEAEVIRREFAMGNDDADRAFHRLLYRTAFRVHPFGQPVIGHLDVFNELTREDLFGYYQERYTPRNTFLVITGDVDANALHNEVKQLFGDWKRKADRPVLIPTEPAQLAPRIAEDEFAVSTTRFALSWKIPGVSHEDAPALDVLAAVLGSGRSSRFYQTLREDEKLAHSIYAHAWTPGHEGLFSVGGDCEEGDHDKLVIRVRELLLEVQKNGITEEEFEKARRMFLAESLDSLSTMRGQASDIGSSWLHAHDVDFTKRYLAAVEALSLPDIQRVANEYLVDKTETTVALHPIGASEKKKVLRHKSGGGDFEKQTLSNGMVLLVKKEDRLPLTASYGVFRGGLLAENFDTAGLGSLHTTMLLKGTKNRSASQLVSDIEDRGGSLSAQSGTMTYGMMTETLRPDFSNGLEVLSDMALNPTFPVEALENEKESRIARIRESGERPMTAAMLKYKAAMFSEHILSLPKFGFEETVNTISTEHLFDRHASLTQGANGVLAVCGSVDPDQVFAEAEKTFGQLDSGSRALANLPAIPDSPENVVITEALNKEQAIVLFGYRGLSLLDEDYLALEILEEACSDMASPLFHRIREELGLAYFVGAGQFTSYLPGTIYFYAGTSKDQAELVEEELMKEVASIAKEGLPKQEIERAKATYLGKTQLGLQGNLSLAQTVALNELHGFGHEHHLTMQDKISNVDEESIRRVAELLKGTPPVRVKVLPTD